MTSGAVSGHSELDGAVGVGRGMTPRALCDLPATYHDDWYGTLQGTRAEVLEQMAARNEQPAAALETYNRASAKAIRAVVDAFRTNPDAVAVTWHTAVRQRRNCLDRRANPTVAASVFEQHQVVHETEEREGTSQGTTLALSLLVTGDPLGRVWDEVDKAARAPERTGP